jgi:hypothetical protein
VRSGRGLRDLLREPDSVLVAVVLVIAVLALAFGRWLIDEPPIALSRDISPLDPRLFPSIVLVGIVVVAGLFLANRLRGADELWDSGMAIGDAAEPGGLRRLLLFLALIVACALLLDSTGFLLTMFVLMVATSVLTGNDSLAQILTLSTALPLVIYVVVTHFLRTALPELDVIESALAPVLALLPGF